MRLLSVLVVVLLVAWLAYKQLGGGETVPGSQASYRQAVHTAEAVDVQVQDRFAEQAAQLSRMESGEKAEQP